MGREGIHSPVRQAPFSSTSLVETATSAATQSAADIGEGLLHRIAGFGVLDGPLLHTSLIAVVREVDDKEGEDNTPSSITSIKEKKEVLPSLISASKEEFPPLHSSSPFSSSLITWTTTLKEVDNKEGEENRPSLILSSVLFSSFLFVLLVDHLP